MVLLNSIRQSVRRLVRSPTGELTRAQRFVRYALDLARHCARELARNRAAQMAAALTYRTLFSLVPTAILAMLMFRAFIGVEEAQHWFQDTAYSFLGLSAVVVSEGEASVAETLGEGGNGIAQMEQWQATAGQHLDQIVHGAWDKLTFASIGAPGLVLLIWAALALAVTVEQCFNRIYRCPSGRAWHHRIAIYWAVVTLGPILLFLSLYVAGSVVAWAEDTLHLTAAMRLTGRTAALMASWLLLFLTYVLMPNVRVHWRPALVGSFVAAALWEVAKWGFKFYVAEAVNVSLIYGSLGMIPLFLFWLYLTWLIVLFGLQLTYTLQAMHGRAFEIDELQQQCHLIGDPRWIIGMMAIVGRGFGGGKPVSAEQVSGELLLDTDSITEMGIALEEAGMVHRLEGSGRHEGGYTLALPPDRIRVATLLDLGRTLAESKRWSGDHAAKALLDRMDVAQHEVVGEATLATIVSKQ